MSIEVVIKKTWLSRKPKPISYLGTALLLFLVIIGYFIYQTTEFNADQWMSANPKQIFIEKEYWRVWTTLFAHADFYHLASNLFLFIPFSYLLMSYFSFILFPGLGMFIGGIVNVFVLSTMADNTALIGISGVVSWMGSVWLTLYFLIQRGESFRHRLAKVLIITAVLFVPEKFDPQVSYLSHFLGYVFGLICGVIYYLLNLQKFLKSEEIELFDDEMQVE